MPEVEAKKMLHYGGLRGVIALKECEFVALVGSMHLPDDELAWFAATLHAADVTPPTMLIRKGRKAVAVKRQEGEYDVYGRDMQDARLTLAAQLTTVAEMIQAIGRARPYESRTKQQTVLIYSNMPLPMPVSRAARREEYLRSLNITTIATPVPTAQMPERIRVAMQELSAGCPFGYGDIAKKLSLAETTLKTDGRYKAAIVLAADALGLRFVRGGDGQPGCFTKEHEPISDLGAVPKDIILGTAPNSDLNLINPLPPKTSYLDAVCDQVGRGLQAFFSSRFKLAPAGIQKTVRADFEVDEALTA